MRILTDKREKLFNYCILNKEEMGFIFDELEKQDKEFIEEILEEIDKYIPDEYEDECPICKEKYKIIGIIDKKELKQIIKQKTGFEK